jgi:hypothetical protein
VSVFQTCAITIFVGVACLLCVAGVVAAVVAAVASYVLCLPVLSSLH